MYLGRKTFFVPNWGKLTGSGLYNPAQAHSCGGRHPRTTLTRPETTSRFPREADAVEEEAETPEGLFRAAVAALLARAGSQEIRVCLPPCGLPRSAPIQMSVTCGRTFKVESSNSKTGRPGQNCRFSKVQNKIGKFNTERFSLPCLSIFFRSSTSTRTARMRRAFVWSTRGQTAAPRTWSAPAGSSASSLVASPRTSRACAPSKNGSKAASSATCGRPDLQSLRSL